MSFEEVIKMETRNHNVGGGEIVTQHRHENYDYWHPATRVHYHKQGCFCTRSCYGDFVPLEERTIENVTREPFASNLKVNGEEIGIPWTLSKDSVSGRALLCEDTKILYLVDSTGYNMSDPKHPYYMFKGATGYIPLFGGKMFCYPDGSIRFLPGTSRPFQKCDASLASYILK